MYLGIVSKNALVLASSKGLGKGVAMELAKEGANVAVCGRDKKTLDSTLKDLQTVGTGKFVSVVGDLTIQEDRNRIINTSLSEFGKIDILVTNSGGPPLGTFESHGLEQWRKAYELLLESTVDMIQQVIPGMKENNWGRIVTITSQAIKQPVKGLILSNSVRASLLGLVKTLSLELGSNGITVNNVLPGFTKTKRLESLMAQRPAMAEAVHEVPLGRFGEVEELAAAVVFLCSERASYISGVSLPVDGGWIKGI